MSPYGIQIPPLSKLNKYLLWALGGAFLLDSILAQVAGCSLRGWTGLHPNSFFAGHIYQLLSFPLVPGSLWEALFDCLIIWFIGGELESLWGGPRYVHFLLSCSLAAGVVFVGACLLFSSAGILTGPGAAACALCVAFGLIFPERVMFFLFFPLKAKWFATILVGLNLYQGIFAPSPVGVWGQLGACACAFLWISGRPPWGKGRRRKKRTPLSLVKSGKGDNGITYH